MHESRYGLLKRARRHACAVSPTPGRGLRWRRGGTPTGSGPTGTGHRWHRFGPHHDSFRPGIANWLGLRGAVPLTIQSNITDSDTTATLTVRATITKPDGTQTTIPMSPTGTTIYNTVYKGVYTAPAEFD